MEILKSHWLAVRPHHLSWPGAEVMVLGPKGFTTAVKGTNGFLCLVERSWGAATDEPDFWNPKVRSPICFSTLPSL